MTKQKDSTTQYWFLLLAALFVIGCGGGIDPKETEFLKDLVPVSGTVTLNGKSVPNASVRFVPVSEATGGRAASGVTDDKGVYVLHTTVSSKKLEETTGALKGDYRVVISRIVKSDGSPVPEGTSDADAMAEGAKESIPERYSDFDKSKLTATVSGETKDQNFDLK